MCDNNKIEIKEEYSLDIEIKEEINFGDGKSSPIEDSYHPVFHVQVKEEDLSPHGSEDGDEACFIKDPLAPDSPSKYPLLVKVEEFSHLASESKSFTSSSDRAGFEKSPVREKGDSVSRARRRPCPFCQKTFRRESELQRHVRTHTGVKPYRCNYCPKAFVETSGLRRHERIHTNAKPYKCRHCRRQFSLADSLDQHMKIHAGMKKEYNCQSCTKIFRTSFMLRRHTRIHTGERPYRCDSCKKTFGEKSSLKRHQIIHIGEKLFKCSYCWKHFCLSANLQRHLSVHEVSIP